MRSLAFAFAFLISVLGLVVGMGWMILFADDAESCREGVLRPDTWTGPHRCSHRNHKIVRDDGLWRCVCLPGPRRHR